MHKVVLFDIDYTMFDTGNYKNSDLTDFRNFSEVVEALESLDPEVTVGIFSEGETNHQLSKLLNTGIKKYFADEHVHIFAKKLDSLAEVLEKYQEKKLYFIDDRLDVLQVVKKSDPSVTTIWIKRGKHAAATPEIVGFTPDKDVLDLKEIGRLIS